MTVPSSPDATAAPPDVKPGPVGIGGWLILPMLGFIGTILLTGWNLLQALQTWDGLVAIVRATEGPLTALKVPLVTSIIAGLFVIFSAAACLYLMFAKKRAIVTVATVHYAVLAVAGLLDLWTQVALEQAVPGTPTDPSTIKEAIRGVVIAAIWVPYFNVSKRVRNTMVN